MCPNCNTKWGPLSCIENPFRCAGGDVTCPSCNPEHYLNKRADRWRYVSDDEFEDFVLQVRHEAGL